MRPAHKIVVEGANQELAHRRSLRLSTLLVPGQVRQPDPPPLQWALEARSGGGEEIEPEEAASRDSAVSSGSRCRLTSSTAG